MALLEVSGLVAGYQAGTVLHGVDLDVEEGGAVAILGRNGVGKTTLIHTIMGLVRARAAAAFAWMAATWRAGAPTWWHAPVSRSSRRAGGFRAR